MGIRAAYQNYLLGQSGITDVVDRRIGFGPWTGAATGLLTLTANVGNTETVTVGDNTYTFQTILTNTANNVLVGGTRNDSIANLIAAITRASGNGTTYAEATVVHPKAWARRDVSATMTAFGRRRLIEALATTETLDNGSWGQTTFNVFPYVVVSDLGSVPERHMGGGSPLARVTLQVDSIGRTITDAESADDAVFAETHGKGSGNIGSPAVAVSSMTVLNRDTELAAPSTGSEQSFFRRMQEVSIWYKETVPTF